MEQYYDNIGNAIDKLQKNFELDKKDSRDSYQTILDYSDHITLLNQLIIVLEKYVVINDEDTEKVTDDIQAICSKIDIIQKRVGERYKERS